ncbi:hypothetical protein CLU81_0459 [Flavobacterium sp. 9]|nr:hypothetical protein CLU81_0459 [Flavobacterium sp. 9]
MKNLSILIFQENSHSLQKTALNRLTTLVLSLLNFTKWKTYIFQPYTKNHIEKDTLTLFLPNKAELALKKSAEKNFKTNFLF